MVEYVLYGFVVILGGRYVFEMSLKHLINYSRFEIISPTVLVGINFFYMIWEQNIESMNLEIYFSNKKQFEGSTTTIT